MKKAGKGKATLNANSEFKKRFRVPRESTKCMVRVRFKGDAGHFASAGKMKFRC